MTDTVIIKEDENKPEETIQEPVVIPEDKSTEIAQAASNQAQDMVSMAASIAAMLDQAKASAGNIEGFFNIVSDRLTEIDRKLDELIKLEIEEEEEEENSPAEIVVVPETPENATEEVVEVKQEPEKRTKTSRRFI